MSLQHIVIEAKNLTKVYKLYNSPVDRLKESLHPLRRQYHHEYFALNNISFEIKQGESVGVIGRNGSGKSTLLKILTGVLTPTSGAVAVNGKVSALLELGAGFNPELTGLENVYFNGMLMGYTREEMDARLSDILSFADIGEFVYQPVKTYSSGMFVRLAFALAVNVDPDILIIDEALAVGDIMFQSKCMDRINQMTKGGVTTLFVTHDMNSVNTLCDRAIMLDSGQIYSQGKPQMITLQYYQLMREKEQSAKFADTKEDADKKYLEMKNSIKDKCSSIDYQYGTGAAKILNYIILNSADQETVSIESGETFKLRLMVEFYEQVDNPCFGFAISNIVGQNLLVAHSFFDSDEQFGPRNRGEVVHVELLAGMLLNPGHYLLSFGVADHATSQDFTNLDTRKNVCTLHVWGKEQSQGIIYHQPKIRIL